MLPEETFDEARRAAAETPESMQSQSGAMLAKLFIPSWDGHRRHSDPYILKTGLMMLLLTLLGAVATIAVTFLATRIAAAVARNMRRDVFSKVEKLQQQRVRPLLHRLPHHAHHEQRHPDSDAHHHGYPYALLCADHGRRRRCDGAAKELLP